MKPLILAIFVAAALPAILLSQHESHEPRSGISEEGLGRAHMETSCSPAVSVDFDRALALLHNFWYVRAFERFDQVAKNDPECGMAYWGAAMTYNHPFWDPPSPADEAAAWALVQKGLRARKARARETVSGCRCRSAQGCWCWNQIGARRQLPQSYGSRIRQISRRRNEVVLWTGSRSSGAR